MNKGNILILTYWSYKDPLIQTYTLPYVRIIRNIIPKKNTIHLVTFENPLQKIDSLQKENIKHQLKEEGVIWIDYSYSRIGLVAYLKVLSSIFFLLVLSIKEKINVIHCWCTPAGSIGYLLSLITGKKLIIDSYEPHAEAMVENGTWKKNGLAYKLLFFFERLQSKRAIAVIALVESMRDYVVKKYKVRISKMYTKPSCVDLIVFNKENFKQQVRIPELENKIVCVYAGKFGGIYLEKEVFDFFKTASDFWGNKFAALLLTNTTREKIEMLARQAGLDPNMIINMSLTHADIPKYLAMADFAINPVKPVPTKRYCTSIKDGEYWAMGLPVVITKNISDDSDIIRANNTGAIIETLDQKRYGEVIQTIDKLLTSVEKTNLQKKIREIAVKYRNFSLAEKVYGEIYNG